MRRQGKVLIIFFFYSEALMSARGEQPFSKGKRVRESPKSTYSLVYMGGGKHLLTATHVQSLPQMSYQCVSGCLGRSRSEIDERENGVTKEVLGNQKNSGVMGDGCCARGRPIIVEWERDARHSAGLSRSVTHRYVTERYTFHK
ncbi:hypothetical protein EVAR_9556_1 [Eumeta japonica]|uniref:Secreted protein n=1 Tax=Eumeta variegata TaxID=151549 RepID=A0A4C1U4S9_EUMVA|nr:hypothetical protein EVAR_9556_1 [Eumeta japonica]